MLAGGAGCSQPQAIEQARKDFKIYMGKLLEHSAALNTLRTESQHSGGADDADTGSHGPAWGPPLNGASDGRGSMGGGRRNHSSAATALYVPTMQFSPGYFQAEHTWPRAGAVTPPRPRPPPNFCWAAESPVARRADPVSAVSGNSLFSAFSSSPAPLASQQRRRGRFPVDELANSAGSRGRLHREEEGEGEGEGEEEEHGVRDDDGWKVRWSRRLCRGPIHSEYQERFPWPPRSALVSRSTGGPIVAGTPARGRQISAYSAGSARRAEAAGSGTGGGGMMMSPATPRPARSVSPLPTRRRGSGGGDGSDGDSIRGRNDGGREGRTGCHPGARSESEPPRSRGRAAIDSQEGGRGRGAGGNELFRSSVVDSAASDRGGGLHNLANGAMATAVGHVEDGGGGGGDTNAEAAGSLGGRHQEAGAGQEEEEREKEEEEEEDVEGDHARAEGRWRWKAGLDRREAEWEGVGNHLRGDGASGGDSRGGGRRWETRGREHVGGWSRGRSSRMNEGGSPLRFQEGRANLGELERGPAAKDGAGMGLDGWKENGLGRRQAATMSGGRTIDCSSQSILTEYMDEFMWPSTLPPPGRRGKRTGMGVDHVGRLLAGRRAEEPRREPDPGVVARLGAVADGALKARSPGHLAEMCRLKSPSHPCRRLVLGLVVALGLRWRRWSDIRTHLLGNKSELVGFLRSFDKDRPGLTSAAIRAYVDDPGLSPAEVKRVAACMVWVSRWLRALHDYLAAKEGDYVTNVTTETAPAAALSGRAWRRRHRRGNGRLRETVPGSAQGKVPERGRLGEKAAELGAGRVGEDGGSIGSGGGGGGGGGRGGRGDNFAQARRVPAAVAATIPGAAAAARPEERGNIGVGADHGGDHGNDEESCGGHSRRGSPTNQCPSQTVATRGDGSVCPPASSAATGEGRRGRANQGGGLVGAREKRGGNGAAAAGVGAGFAGSRSGGDDLESESQWTTGTVTSRGDVLGAPTEDQVDVGSRVTAWDEKENASTVRPRHRYGGDPGNGTSAHAESAALGAPAAVKRGGRSAGVAAPTARTRNTTAAFERHPKGERGRSDTRRGLPQRAQTSHVCIYQHEPKARTPSRIANPNARRPLRVRSDPILANTRWPPAVSVRKSDRTEQRSAFSLEHSFLAYE